MSGAGIEHLAGDWEEDDNRGADVAQHPIVDRSEPVVLIENRKGLSARQILDLGDQDLANLYKAQLDDWQHLLDLRQKAGDRMSQGVYDAQVAYEQSGDAIQQYVERFNEQRDPSLVDSKRQDQIARARILRRYRLYSFQPDEMITFRALAQMHPSAGDFDPRLYQYGGLWIYPVGGLLKAAGYVGLVTLSNDPTTYLDHPELFGRFYLVARAYSAAWGLVGILAVFALVKRFTGSEVLAACAGVCFVAMPVVVDLAHEAKPHLVGGVILMLAVLAVCKYVDEGKSRWWILASILCGAAGGMVLSDLVGLIVIPAMVLVKREKPARGVGIIIAGGLIAGLVYFATNPYVAIHLLGDRRVLESNLGNSRAMYSVGSLSDSVINALRLVAIGPGVPLAVAGVIGSIVLLLRKRCGVGWILAILAVASFVPFAVAAAGKPGEYARFALVPDIALMIAAFCAVGWLARGRAVQAILGLVLIAAAGAYSFAYERGFVRDASGENSRTEWAVELNEMLQQIPRGVVPTLWVDAEPAPYCMPPVDLFRWRIILYPKSASFVLPDDQPYLRPGDSVDVLMPGVTPISWANKGFTVFSWSSDSPMVPSSQP